MDVEKTVLEALLKKLDMLETRLRELNANNRVAISTIQDHGTIIARLEKTVKQLKIHCPLLKLDIGELNNLKK